MPLIRKLSKTGGSDSLLIPSPFLDQMNLGSGDEVVLELLGDALLIRRANAEPPDLPQILIALEALGHAIDLPHANATTQRVLLCLRAFGPIKAVEVAEKLGRSREWASKMLAQLARDGVARKTSEGYELSGECG